MRLRMQLRDLAKEYRAKEREYVKQFRHEIAILKRQGVVRKDYDARSIVPNPALEAARTKFADIITGKTAARRVKSKRFLETLKKSGANVLRNLVILPKEQYVRKEKIVDRSGRKRGQRKARMFLPLENQEGFIEDLFSKLNKNQYITFDVAGNPVKFLFQSPSAFRDWINRYLREEPKLEEYIEIYEIDNEEKYRETVKAHKEAVERRKRKRGTERKRASRKRRSGKKNTR